jgi:hypothetical protein
VVVAVPALPPSGSTPTEPDLTDEMPHRDAGSCPERDDLSASGAVWMIGTVLSRFERGRPAVRRALFGTGCGERI